ncbi:MAG: methylmalonyl-CoA mutase, partial [Leptospiraceae bacterium]|nr:methylmalonyl-CoA mutase [Leptospiraceae bacterium]
IEALPSFHNLVVHASDYHNAGAGTAAELGISLAHGAEYLAGLQSSGMDVGAVAKTLQFSFSVSASYFVEIAKFRAFRLLWANILSAYGIKGALPVFIQARTSEWNKTLYDPHVNILRGTTEAMSAAIAGCDSISVSHFDSVYSHGDEFSLRIARNTQHLLKHESYLNRVKDPSAGSYYIENLTDKLAESAWKVFQDIETKGGFIAALKEGYIQSLLQSFKAERAKNVASRKEILLGTNQYPILKEESLSRLEKISKPLSLKTSGKAVSTESIQKLSEALESGALLGDILQSSFKKTEEGIQPVTVFRASEAFEAIRLATEKYGKQKGASPSVFLAGFGNLAMRIARATFSSNFFACAGYRILDNPAFNQASDIAEAYLKSGAEILVLCSSDEEYGEMGVSVAKLVKEKKPSAQLIIAGNPAALIDSLKGAGVDDFIHVRTDVLGFLTQMQNKLGIKVGE